MTREVKYLTPTHKTFIERGKLKYNICCKILRAQFNLLINYLISNKQNLPLLTVKGSKYTCNHFKICEDFFHNWLS